MLGRYLGTRAALRQELTKQGSRSFASASQVTAETAKLADSPQCPICLEDAPLQQVFFIVGELMSG